MRIDIGHTVKVLRAIDSISQAELAKRLEVSPAHISLLESGRRDPSLPLLESVIRYFGLTQVQFFILMDRFLNVHTLQQHIGQQKHP